MKTIKQFREEYDSKYLVHNAPNSLMLEGRGAMKTARKTIPSPSDMPNMLLFRRVAYRLYPNKQVVALYYSKTVDKYLSVPFGPDGNLNLSESEIHEGAKWEAVKGAAKGAAKGAIAGHIAGTGIAAGPGAVVGTAAGAAIGAYKGARKAYKNAKEKDMNEDWQSVNRKDKTDGLSQAAVNAYRRENPGSKLQTAVTEKNPSGKRAARRKSFCARMGGMKKRLTSAKTARDPDSRINKALRRWNCEESFQNKLATLREERLEENAIVSVGRALAVPAASAVTKIAPRVVAKAKDIASRALSKFKSKSKPKDVSPKAGKTPKSPKLAAADAAARLAKSASSDSDKQQTTSSDDSAITHRRGELIKDKPGARAKSSWERARTTDDTFAARQRAALSREYSSSQKVQENKIEDIQNMINENIDTMDITINERTITLNNSMAKKILRVYESVNAKNKKIVESMLNEDLDSFKKLLNFSIKA